jgi:hypothetical protein
METHLSFFIDGSPAEAVKSVPAINGEDYVGISLGGIAGCIFNRHLCCVDHNLHPSGYTNSELVRGERSSGIRGEFLGKEACKKAHSAIGNGYWSDSTHPLLDGDEPTGKLD